MNIIYFGVCVYLQLTLGVLVINANQLQQPQANEIADETIKLIDTGRELITFNPAYKNAVLVMGNTGAGKTTTTKFITGQPLESYKKSGKFLIKDAGGKISTGSTLVSKTIFPEMFVDEESNTAYYDLPGFSDTRNASIELANAWFMKLVADQVEKVKILVVVTHSSLIPGESRTDFKDLLDHATKFLLHPKKFQASIALVATKVNSYIPDEEIIPNIAEFLETEKETFHNIFGEGTSKLREVVHLVDALLAQSPNGDYERIGFFKSPNKPGSLDQIPEAVARRRALKNLIENKLTFVKKEEQDFGISISDNARFYVRVIVEKLNSKFTETMSTLATSIEKQFQPSESQGSPVQSFVGKLVQDVAQLDQMTTALQKSTSRSSFLEVLQKQSPTLEDFNPIMKELRNLDANLEFYEKIDKRTVAPESLEWTEPIRAVVNKLQTQVSKLLETLNSKAGAWTTEMVRTYEKSYKQVLTNGLSQPPATQETIKQSLSQDLQILETMKNSLLTQPSFNSFLNLASKSFGDLSVKISSTPSNQPPLLANDIIFKGHPELIFDSWIRTIYQLLQSITREKADFIRTLQEREHKKGIESLNSNITDLQRKNEQISKNATESIGRLSQDIKNQREEILKKTKNVENLQNNVNQVTSQLTSLNRAKEEAERKAQEQARENARIAEQMRKVQEDLANQKRRAAEAQRQRDREIELMRQRAAEAQAREDRRNEWRNRGCRR